MTIWRQCYLGASNGGTLRVKLIAPRRKQEILGPCFIAILPEELLGKIFSFVPPKSDPWGCEEDEGPFSITVICSSWRRVYEPVLFCSIRMTWNIDRRITKLLGILKTRPHLHCLPRTIHLHLSCYHMSENTYIAAAEVMKFCKMIRSIELWGTSMRAVSFSLMLLSVSLGSSNWTY